MPITFEEIYKDFKLFCPDLRDLAIHYKPITYTIILVYLSDGRVVIYRYSTKQVEWI